MTQPPGDGRPDTGVPALQVSGLRKSFSGVEVLQDVDLVIQPGQVNVLIGQNGSGKSTIIKTLAGYHKADAGEAWVGGETLTLGDPQSAHSVGLRFVHQDLGLVENDTIVNNIGLVIGFPSRLGTISDRAARRKTRELLGRVGLDLDPTLPISALTASERTGVAIARAIGDNTVSEARVLVLDEPTATLPVNEVDRLLRTIRQATERGLGILYVTHHLEEVFRIADTVTILRDGQVVSSLPVASLDHDALVSRLVGRSMADLDKTRRPSGLTAPTILSVDGVAGGPAHDVSFELHAGEIVGFTGITGSGRESILGAIVGASPRIAGAVRVGETPLAPYRPDLSAQRGLGYLPADRKGRGGVGQLSALENLMSTGYGDHWRGLRFNRRREEAEGATWFERLEVKPAGAWKKQLSTFSGGNQQKVLLGKWMRRPLTALLLDEPTQGVDIGSKRQIHQQLLDLAATGVGILVSSTDTDELVSLCDRVLVMREGSVVASLSGDELTHDSVARSVLSQQVSARRA